MFKATINMGLLALCIALTIVMATWTLSPPGQPYHHAQSQAENTSKKEGAHKSETLWQKTTSDPVAFFTLWLVAFTAVLAGSTIGLWIVTWKASVRQSGDMEASIAAAKQSADIAKSTLIASQRAWIRRDRIYFGGPLVFRPDGLVHSSIMFEFTNVGNAPALHINENAWLLPVTDGSVPEERATELFQQVRQHPVSGGFALFPKQSYPRNRAMWVRHGIDLNREQADAAADDFGRMSLYVAACINYSFASDPDRNHQTSCLFEVHRTTGPFIERVVGEIPEAELQLQDSGFLGMDVAD